MRLKPATISEMLVPVQPRGEALGLAAGQPVLPNPLQTRALNLGSVPISRSGKCGADQLTPTRRYWPMEVNDVLA
jgi:hypothetical protein